MFIRDTVLVDLHLDLRFSLLAQLQSPGAQAPRRPAEPKSWFPIGEVNIVQGAGWPAGLSPRFPPPLDHSDPTAPPPRVLPPEAFTPAGLSRRGYLACQHLHSFSPRQGPPVPLSSWSPALPPFSSCDPQAGTPLTVLLQFLTPTACSFGTVHAGTPRPCTAVHRTLFQAFFPEQRSPSRAHPPSTAHLSVTCVTAELPVTLLLSSPPLLVFPLPPQQLGCRFRNRGLRKSPGGQGAGDAGLGEDRIHIIPPPSGPQALSRQGCP